MFIALALLRCKCKMLSYGHRGIFRAQSNIYNGTFLRKYNPDCKPLTIFAKRSLVDV